MPHLLTVTEREQCLVPLLLAAGASLSATVVPVTLVFTSLLHALLITLEKGNAVTVQLTFQFIFSCVI